jgi:hypothetical protein
MEAINTFCYFIKRPFIFNDERLGSYIDLIYEIVLGEALEYSMRQNLSILPLLAIAT